MGTYISTVNDLIAAHVARLSKAVIFGENINNGSRISGLSRNVEASADSRLINVGNCESTHCGVGFGLMLNGACGVLFSKQLDFMLLGMDHFVNTYNAIRCVPPERLGSFTIITIVCDHGFQGPQSSFNALGDICSLARVNGYTLSNSQDTSRVLGTQLGRPGFRFIALSQRLFSTECIKPSLVYSSPDASTFQYSEGGDATIVCFNFSLPQGLVLQRKLLAQKMTSSLFSVNYVVEQDWEPIRESVARTQRLVVIDDSKSVHLPAYTLLHEISTSLPRCKTTVVNRGTNVDFGVSPDVLSVNFDEVVARLVPDWVDA